MNQLTSIFKRKILEYSLCNCMRLVVFLSVFTINIQESVYVSKIIGKKGRFLITLFEEVSHGLVKLTIL